MNKLTDLFLPNLPAERWQELFEFARKQSILGVTFPFLDELPRGAGAPLNVYSRWALADERIRTVNARQIEAARELCAEFAAAGFRTCVLKGQGSASFYPEPLRRQCGDIDVWVQGTREEILSYVRPRCEKMGDIVYHHCDPKGIKKGVSVEVHFTPTWMNDPVLNRRMQRWFASNADAQFSNIHPDLGFAIPTVPFATAFCVMHIFRHVMDEGIGLRQLMDLYYLLEALPAEEHAGVMSILNSLKLGRFTAALMHVITEQFPLPAGKMLTAPDERRGAFLLDEVMISGNFGKYDSRNAHAAKEGRVGKLIRKTRRQMRFFGLCPREVLAAPLFKMWQYLWRRKNKYLHS